MRIALAAESYPASGLEHIQEQSSYLRSDLGKLELLESHELK
jgi:hypothetical protein